MFRPRFERRIFGMQFRFLHLNRFLGLQHFVYTLFTSYSYVSAVDEYRNYVIGLHWVLQQASCCEIQSIAISSLEKCKRKGR